MRIAHLLVSAGAAGLLVVAGTTPAHASVGPRQYQLLTGAQTRQTMQYLTTPFAQQSSPASCDRAGVAGGALLLPVVAGRPGTRTLYCATRAHAVLIDLGGFVCVEDDDPNSVYTTADGRVLRFVPGTLETICQDAIRFVTPAVLSVDGHTLRHAAVAVGTPEDVSRVHSSTGSYWDSSVALGHPGSLATAYGGYKSELSLDVGRHTIVTDVSAFIGGTTVLTFVVDILA